MIHTPQVIARIEDLLKLSGISSEDSIEEMTDHYLSQIESCIAEGISEQTAIRETYQIIAQTDLKAINQKQRQTKRWLIGILCFSLLMILFVVNSKNSNEQIIVDNPITKTLPTGWPIEGDIGKITSGYGLRMHPIQKTKKFHKGIDIQAPTGTKVLASADGKVIKAEYSTGYGYHIIIEHNEQYTTKYAHLSKITVDVNDLIKEGDIIGKVGSSGLSMTPHLHYEIIKNDKAVDPMKVVAP